MTSQPTTDAWPREQGPPDGPGHDLATLDVHTAAAAIGVPVPAWRGRCHKIACMLVDRKVVAGRPAYGHYYGPVAPSSYFSRSRHLPFQPHGWIVLPDNQVCDPTRWVFEATAPYLYIGPGDDYDEGGNRLLAAQAGPCPPPAGPVAVELRGSPAAPWIVRLADGQVVGGLTVRQAFWLANLPLVTLGHLARPIYELLTETGYRAAIPIDNRLRILDPPDPTALQENGTPPAAASKHPGDHSIVMQRHKHPSTVTSLTAGAAGRRHQ
jgi:hypothetical protein